MTKNGLPQLVLLLTALAIMPAVQACAPAITTQPQGQQEVAQEQGGQQTKPKQQPGANKQGQNGQKQSKPAQPSQQGTSPQVTPVSLSGVNYLLGNPTGDSITMSVLSNADREAYVEYGTALGSYGSKTTVSSLTGNAPAEIVITGLQPDTRYYYRLRYKTAPEPQYSAGSESTFCTARAAGSSFVFTIQADSHRDENTSDQVYRTTLSNALNDKPDFHVDLGDTFMGDKWAKSYQALAGRYADERSFFSLLCQSAPLFLVNGNHEGENGWRLKGNADSLPVWATECRELYYPIPQPGAFYSGSQMPDPLAGLRNSYYAWQWGGALFVVLDPYWYTMADKSPAGWDWTLGREQYDWLKSTLETSDAKYKFVFCHNLVGGFDMGNAGNGRGGSEAAKYYEWGGHNTDGTQGFDQNRPGWGKPIHQLLADTKVNIVFHGHDHFFARQELDGVIYQECPQPGAVSNNDHAGEYGYKDGVFLGGPGYMRVRVSGDTATVDFIRTYLPGAETAGHKNGETAYSYTVNAGGTGR